VTRVAFRLADVFTERPFAGNQLCVVPEPVSIDAATMQSLAREINFSETTFVTEAARDRFAMRVFTPDAELPFAGHPTIGTAFVLAFEGRVGRSVTAEVAAGRIPVEVDLDRSYASMRMLPPEFGDEIHDVESVAFAAGLEPADLHPEHLPQVVSTGLPHLMVLVRDERAMVRARRDEGRLKRLMTDVEAEALYLFAPTEAGVRARMFDPSPNIGEDPATGSAAGPMGAYLASRGLGGLPGRVVVRQGQETGRPSTLHVEVYPEGASWRITVGGGVRVIGEGAFDV
jgi:trans-2,3-dihydro-3-hydroxyanthranilate isomerase